MGRGTMLWRLLLFLLTCFFIINPLGSIAPAIMGSLNKKPEPLHFECDFLSTVFPVLRMSFLFSWFQPQGLFKEVRKAFEGYWIFERRSDLPYSQWAGSFFLLRFPYCRYQLDFFSFLFLVLRVCYMTCHRTSKFFWQQYVPKLRREEWPSV